LIEQNGRPFGPDFISLAIPMSIIEKRKPLSLNNPMHFEQTFEKYMICYDVKQTNKGYYIKWK